MFQFVLFSLYSSFLKIFCSKLGKGNFLPPGRKVWTDSFGEVFCIRTESELSSCILGSQFPCNDGSCIPLDYKCDMFPDCKKEEDEEACDTLECPIRNMLLQQKAVGG